MAKIVIAPHSFTAKQSEEISGVTLDQQRDWKRRGFPVSTEWGTRSALEVATLLLVRTVVAADIGPTVAWRVSDGEVAGAIVVAAAMMPGAIEDRTGDAIFEKNPSARIGWAFKLVGVRHVAGPIFAWTAGVSPSTYGDVDQAMRALQEGEPKAVTLVDLPGLGAAFVARAGVLAHLEKEV